MEVMWATGSHHKIDPRIALQEVETVRKSKGGTVVPEDLVEVARDEANPLHPEFEWDDTKAAHTYRLRQAGGILRHLVVVRKEIKSERPVRVFGVIKGESQWGQPKPLYQSQDEIMADPNLRAQVLQRARSELKSFRNKYADLQELAAVFRAIEKEVVEV